MNALKFTALLFFFLVFPRVSFAQAPPIGRSGCVTCDGCPPCDDQDPVVDPPRTPPGPSNPDPDDRPVRTRPKKKSDKEISREFAKVGDYYWERGDFYESYRNYLWAYKKHRSRENRESLVGAINRLGIAAYNRGDFETARKNWEAGLSYDPKNKALKDNLGLALDRIGLDLRINGRFQEGCELALRAAELSPDREKVQEAATSCRKRMKAEDKAKRLERSGDRARDRGNYEDALKYYHDARSDSFLSGSSRKDLEEKFEGAVRTFGRESVKKGRFREAAKVLSEYMRDTSPDENKNLYAAIRGQLGVDALDRGDKEAAVKEFDVALHYGKNFHKNGLWPVNNAMRRDALADRAVQNGDYAGALEHLRRAIELLPSDEYKARYREIVELERYRRKWSPGDSRGNEAPLPDPDVLASAPSPTLPAVVEEKFRYLDKSGLSWADQDGFESWLSLRRLRAGVPDSRWDSSIPDLFGALAETRLLDGDRALGTRAAEPFRSLMQRTIETLTADQKKRLTAAEKETIWNSASKAREDMDDFLLQNAYAVDVMNKDLLPVAKLLAPPSLGARTMMFGLSVALETAAKSRGRGLSIRLVREAFEDKVVGLISGAWLRRKMLETGFAVDEGEARILAQSFFNWKNASTPEP